MGNIATTCTTMLPTSTTISRDGAGGLMTENPSNTFLHPKLPHFLARKWSSNQRTTTTTTTPSPDVNIPQAAPRISSDTVPALPANIEGRSGSSPTLNGDTATHRIATNSTGDMSRKRSSSAAMNLSSSRPSLLQSLLGGSRRRLETENSSGLSVKETNGVYRSRRASLDSRALIVQEAMKETEDDDVPSPTDNNNTEAAIVEQQLNELSTEPGSTTAIRSHYTAKQTRRPIVTVKVLRARNLLPKDPNGLSDPYVVISMGPVPANERKNPNRCSHVQQANLNPVWDFSVTFEMYLLDQKPASFIRIDVFDDDTVDHISGKKTEVTDKSKNDFLGRVDIELPMETLEDHTQWYILKQRSSRSHVSGEVLVSLKIVMADYVTEVMDTINHLPEPRPRPPPRTLAPHYREAKAENGVVHLCPGPRVWDHQTYPTEILWQDVVHGKFWGEASMPQYLLTVHQDFCVFRENYGLPPCHLILKSMVKEITNNGVELWGGQRRYEVEFKLHGSLRQTRVWFVDIKGAEILTSAMAVIESPQQYRFGASYAPLTCPDSSPFKFFGSGMEYFHDLSETLMAANETIFIADWMLSPEVQLRRDSLPFDPRFRLDNLLKFKAEEGVLIYVLIFDDKEFIGLRSDRVVKILEGLHANVYVIKHRSPLLANAYFSHHQKFVVVDWRICYVGGIDLCFGRYDEPNHPVVDVSPPFVWPGADYYNPRVRAHPDLDMPFMEHLNRDVDPRLPWQDVQARFEGEIAFDLGTMFAKRWCHHRMSKTKGKQSLIPIIVPPTRVSRRWEVKSSPAEVADDVAADAPPPPPPPIQDDDATSPPAPTPQQQQEQEQPQPAKLQLLLSIAEWSSNPAREDSIHQAMLDLIENSQKYVYIESQFFISNASDAEREVHKQTFAEVAAAPLTKSTKQAVRTVRAIGRGIKNRITTMSLRRRRSSSATKPDGRDDEYDTGKSTGRFNVQTRHSGDMEEGEGQNLPHHSGAFRLPPHQTGGGTHLLSDLGRSTLPAHIREKLRKTFTRDTTHKTFIVNSVAQALYRRLVRAITSNQEDFCVIIVLPNYPEGHYAREKYSQAVMHYAMHTICMGSESLLGRLHEAFPNTDLSRYIRFFSLMSFSFVGMRVLYENVYVHSKLMIVDDNRLLVGSANINDRSLIGQRDSEVAVLVEDCTDKITAFRKLLWSRHLGMKDSNDPALTDVVKCFHEEWTLRSRMNTGAFESVFPDMPSSKFTTFESIGKGKGPNDPKKLSQVKGFVIDQPMFFLADEVLLPTLTKKEGLIVEETMYQ